MGSFLRRVEDNQRQQQQQQQQQLVDSFRKASVAAASPSKNFSFKELLCIDDNSDDVAVEAAADAAKGGDKRAREKKFEFLTFRDAVDGVRLKYGHGTWLS